MGKLTKTTSQTQSLDENESKFRVFKKGAFFQKKTKKNFVLFCLKITSTCRKLISKLVSESSESILWVYEA